MKTLTAAIFIAANLLSTLAHGQNAAPANPIKRELAVRVVGLQQGAEMDRLVDQLAGSAVQPLVQFWGGKLEANVAPAEQQAAVEKLNAALDKFNADANAIIKSKLPKVSDESLVGAYLEKFTEDELRQLNAFFSAPVIKKYQALAPELGQLMVRQLMEAARNDIQERARAFDETALQIVGADKPQAATPDAPAAARPAAPVAEKPTAKAKK